MIQTRWSCCSKQKRSKRRKSLPAQPIYEKRCKTLEWLISRIFTFSANREVEPRFRRSSDHVPGSAGGTNPSRVPGASESVGVVTNGDPFFIKCHMEGSDFSCSFFIGFDSSSSRRGPL